MLTLRIPKLREKNCSFFAVYKNEWKERKFWGQKN